MASSFASPIGCNIHVLEVSKLNFLSKGQDVQLYLYQMTAIPTGISNISNEAVPISNAHATLYT